MPSSCPMSDTNAIRVAPMKDAQTFKNVKDLFAKSMHELVTNDIAKWRNNISEVQQSMGDVHKLIRKHVAEGHRQTGLNIYPLLVASEEGRASDPKNHGRQGIGGVYTLYRTPNEIYKCTPVHPVYEMTKIACHLVLGTFVIIEPHLTFTTDHKGTARLRFYHKLKEYLNALVIASKSIKSIKNAKDIKQLFHNQETQQLILNIVDESIHYCDCILRSKHITKSEFDQHCDKIIPIMKECMAIATDFQARNTIEMLLKWKDMMSAEEWNNLYAVIPTVWVTAANCPREQILRSVMSKENQNTHIIIGENIDNEYDARILCGRVVHDRIMSRYVFGINDTWSQRKCQGLGSRQDSLSDYSRESIQRYANEHKLTSRL